MNLYLGWTNDLNQHYRDLLGLDDSWTVANVALDSVHHVGMDEKSLGKGHDYVSVMTDLDHRRALDVSKDRTIAAADVLWQTLNENQ